MTIRRLKTYAGSQGYVYQYYFVGQRPSPDSDATEYIFDVTSDGKTSYAVSVVLPRQALRDWHLTHGRALTNPEQYAAVKLRLFRAFDEVADLFRDGRELEVATAFLDESLTSLGIE
ncbi:MAG TPA: hypothetical protein VLT90_06200 [Terriglobales bacterium]|nr:hypothetical protein [Terriglobales bacterium]